MAKVKQSAFDRLRMGARLNRKERRVVAEILENAEEYLTPRMRNLLALLWNEWKELEQQLVDLNQ